MFLEQVFNPIENRPTLSKEEIDASFDNFYGKGERPLTLPDDMSGQYNTQLTPDEESAYQAWAKGQGREKDVFNYDLRGAWKELQSGTMSEDERGHLGDKYKKPNHPTFSTESIYNGKDGYQGGIWSRNGNVDVYTPQHKLTPEQAKRLKLYFAQNEEGVALNLKDKVYDNPTIQLAPKSVGAFDGLAKGILYPIPNALVRMGSGALMVASKAMPWVRDDFLKQMEQASLDLDKWNRANFGANPETMGKATQVIHGLVGMLAELGVLTTGVGGAAGLAIKGVGAAEKLRKTSIAVGSALFGTDIGISERNRLVAEGVDEDTAFKAGAVSGLLNTIGAAIPPFLGSSRTWSAMYGAGSNVALNYAELSTISYVLDHQDYTELAKQYELNMVDMLVSAGVGAFMGTVFWRNPVDVKYDRAHQRVYERYKSDLEAGGKFSQEEIESQAKLNAAAAVSYARMAHIAPDQVDDMATKLVWTDDRKAFAVPEEYAMPITQGSEWHMGPSPKRNAEEQIPVLKITEAPLGRKDAIAYTTAILKDGVKNKDSGFVLTASRSDMKKAAGKKNGWKERVFSLVANKIDAIAENAVLVENHAEVLHKNPKVQGVHIFALPVEMDGGLWRIQLLVKDVIEPRNERTTIHTIDGIEIYKMENPPVGITQSEGGVSYVEGIAAADNRQVRNVTENGPNDRTVSLSQLLGGDKSYIRQDGKGFFDSVDDASRAEGGVYYEPREYNQIIGEYGVSVMDQADENWSRTNNRNVALQMEYSGKTPKEIRLATGWERGADGKWRYEIPDIKIREDGFRMLRDREKAIRDKKDDWAYSDEGINASIEEGKSHEAAIDSAHESDVLTTTLDKLVDAPDLFKAYPQLRKMTVEFGKLPKGTRGYLSLGTMTMRLGLDAGVFANSTRSTLIHEIQHAVQEIEGFARGADPKRMPGKGGALFIDMQRLRELRGSSDWREYQEAADEMLRQSEAETSDDAAWKRATSRFDAAEKLPGVQDVRAEEKRLTDKWGDSPDVLQAINNAADITDPVFARITESDPHYRYQSYARVAGEVEARNAQTRKDMTPEERAETLLRDTESVPRNEQIITSREYLQKGQEGIRGAFNPSTNTIRLTPNANLSTFSHEHAHWYLTNTLALGGKEGAPLELQSQINAILHAFGLKSINEWNALGFEGQRKYQEQFAAWTEIYLTQGKSPVKELEGVFAKMAEWLIGMYKAALGKDAGPDAAVREVSDRYQAQFGEKLPELSPEVRKVLDTMYGAQQKRSAFKSSKAQTMAGRLVQAQRVNQTKVSAPISDPHGPTAGNVGQAAQGKAVSDLNNGRKVDVSEQVGDTEANVPVVEDTQSTFARGVSIGVGANSRVVVLQNRNRSDPNSVAQMNSIATDPQYGRLSTSRTTQSGAPIVSFGHLPDKAYQGKSEIITESNGNKVPVTYYVVEADDVMRSNNYDGMPNKEWNNDNPDQMRAIAGNGRMAGLSEAYNRGTAEQYRQDLMADSDNHGVSPETIKGMKKPVLVRYMPPDRVTTGFVERSNTSDVLVRSSLETAVQDSPKVRKNIGKYEFDEDGDPTKETLGQFLTDVGEVSEMGNLIDSNGNPTTAARARIKAAVFYEAYRDKRLTELVADSEDKHGIKRILSAMSAFAPHVIQIRETSSGAIDLAPIITDATHRILQARINGEGVDFTAQGDMFSSNPATEMVTNFLSQNRNSAAAMLRVLRPFAEQVENALQAADSPMFADLAVKTDLADAMALFRKAENQEIRNRSGDLLGDADGKLLPEIDVEAMRSSLANTLKDGKNLVDAISDGVAETNRMATPEAKAEAQQQHLIEQQNAREVLSENSEAVRARNFALEDPNRELVMTDEAGNDIVISAREAMAQADAIEKGLNDDTAGLGMGVACIIRNQGIR
jgi:hypothetical protein